MKSVFIPVAMKSLNKLKGFGKFGGYKYKNERRKWGQLVGIYFGRRKEGCSVFVSAKFVRIYSGRERMLDIDNLYGGTKPLRDALKRHGWIHDDSPKWIKYTCTQERGDVSGVRIEINEVQQ